MKLRPDKKQKRQREAQERLQAWQDLTIGEQQAIIKNRRGNSDRQAMRLFRWLIGTEDVPVKRLKNKVIKFDESLLEEGIEEPAVIGGGTRSEIDLILDNELEAKVAERQNKRLRDLK